jgi:hypothetical protein
MENTITVGRESEEIIDENQHIGTDRLTSHSRGSNLEGAFANLVEAFDRHFDAVDPKDEILGSEPIEAFAIRADDDVELDYPQVEDAAEAHLVITRANGHRQTEDQRHRYFVLHSHSSPPRGKHGEAENVPTLFEGKPRKPSSLEDTSSWRRELDSPKEDSSIGFRPLELCRLVGGRVDLLRSLDADMGVALGGVELAVTKHFLDVADVGAAFEHQRREGVAQQITCAFAWPDGNPA